MKRFLVYEESSGKSNTDRSMGIVSCGYELKLCDYTMSMFMLWTNNAKGYISGMI